MDKLLAINEADPRFKILQLARNFRMDGGLTAGLNVVDADAVVLMTADLQDPPEFIPEMIRTWEQGYENVYGVVTERRWHRPYPQDELPAVLLAGGQAHRRPNHQERQRLSLGRPESLRGGSLDGRAQPVRPGSVLLGRFQVDRAADEARAALRRANPRRTASRCSTWRARASSPTPTCRCGLSLSPVSS